MNMISTAAISLAAAIGYSFLPPRSSQGVTDTWWLRGLIVWVILMTLNSWVFLRPSDLVMLTGTNVLSWAGFLGSTVLVSALSVMLIWPGGSKTVPRWRLELGMGFIALAARCAWVLW